ncbi:MAG: hypothetical protein PHR35_04080 [Kiritimatiellae bacterium]|nr:hypothetical protein [Kiritimatiellia bacterium]
MSGIVRVTCFMVLFVYANSLPETGALATWSVRFHRSLRGGNHVDGFRHLPVAGL